jgi:hypothetical protein
VWATSPNFQVTPAELQEIVGAYKDTSTPKKVQSTGLHIAGQKYIVIKADETSLYGKKVRQTGHSACMGDLTPQLPQGNVETACMRKQK